MNITLALKMSLERLAIAEAYSQAAGQLEKLAAVHPDFREWWCTPRGPKESFLPFRDRMAVLKRQEEEALEFPELQEHGAPGFLLTNAGDEKTWRERGRVALTIDPSFGQLRLQIRGIDQVFKHPTEMLWGALSEMTKDPRVLFAQTNVQQRVGGELLLYSTKRAVFAHREFLGWMGYVNDSLALEQVPDAARLERQGKGTLILATEVLDLGNPAAIKQANQVEMSLADLDLLPITDPSFL